MKNHPKTLQELEELHKQRLAKAEINRQNEMVKLDEQKRINLSIELGYCPTCGSDIRYEEYEKYKEPRYTFWGFKVSGKAYLPFFEIFGYFKRTGKQWDKNEYCSKELADILKNIKGRFLLSYWYFDGIEDLYSWCKIETKSTLMGTEWLIMNF